MNSKKHNGIISIWKFLFSLMIVILHSKVLALNGEKVFLSGGSIGVEFFFITSGVLLATEAFKHNSDNDIISDTWKMLWKKIKAIFPYVLISYILLVVIEAIFSSHNIYDWISSIWDLLLLKMVGFRTLKINGVTWYLSSMFLVMLIIYPLLRKYKKTYSRYIAPLIVILLSGYMSYKFGHLRTETKWLEYTYKGNLRAFLEINLGIVVYEIAIIIKNIKFTYLGKILLMIIEICCFSSIFVIAQVLSKGTKLDFLMLFILATGITLAFSTKSYSYDFCCNKIFYFLEKLSVPIYVVQLAIIYFIGYLPVCAKLSYYTKLGIVLITTIIISICLLKLVNVWQKNKIKIFKFLKGKLIID